MMWFRFVAALSLLLVLPIELTAAEPEVLHIRSGVLDSNGDVSAIIELPEEPTGDAPEFQLWIEGKPVATARETRGRILDIMFLVDVSRSMEGSKGDSPLKDAKDALSAFPFKSRAEDRFALTVFADDDLTLSSFDDPGEKFKEVVRDLKTKGNKTLLYDALKKALDNELKNRSKDDHRTRKIFVVISDGKDEGSKIELEKLMEDSKHSGVPIYTVFRGRTEPPFRAVLNALATKAGGDYFFARNVGQLASRLEEIYRLETKSRLVRFTYQKDIPERMTRNAEIEFRRANAAPLKAQFPGAIPLASRPLHLTPWLFGLLLIMLLSGVAVWVWRRSREKEKVDEIVPVGTGTTDSEIIQPPPPPPRHRTTTVIAQYFPVPTAGQPTAMLLGVTGSVEGQRHSVEKEFFSIGASAENDLSIGEDEYVSGEHAYLRYEKGSLFIFDKGSRNGTFVNDDKVTPTGVVLHPGDHIKFGTSTFELVMPSR
jgi:Mg-chelatase subunit ChlD